MSQEIIIMASAKPKPEFYDDCKAALLELRVPTLEEAGCLQFDIFENKENDGKLYFFECFANQESFDLHFTYDYTQKVFDAYSEWLEEEIEIIKLKAAE